jgi:indolepyruvate ferredoxin oxidoreductase
MERRLIRDYEVLLDEIEAGLTAENLKLAIALAELPEQIKGYGPIKMAAVERYALALAQLRARWPGNVARESDTISTASAA